MSMLAVQDLNKRYETFHLKDVSFRLEKGYIMGFIGANGAGKTTTLKLILNTTKADSGTVEMFGQPFKENEVELKQNLGVMFGGTDYYANSTLKTISDVVRRFYDQWDDAVYYGYMKRFGLNPEKKLKELSDGMRVKFSLVLAMSHNAKLFLLDEPTSGLDPVARDDLLELFQELVADGEKSILFSTHITSDLEKCADYITYINNGEVIESLSKDELIQSYRLVKGPMDKINQVKNKLISYKTSAFGFTGLIQTKDIEDKDGLMLEAPNLEDIMIYYAKREGNDEEFTV